MVAMLEGGEQGDEKRCVRYAHHPCPCVKVNGRKATRILHCAKRTKEHDYLHPVAWRMGGVMPVFLFSEAGFCFCIGDVFALASEGLIKALIMLE